MDKNLKTRNFSLSFPLYFLSLFFFRCYPRSRNPLYYPRTPPLYLSLKISFCRVTDFLTFRILYLCACVPSNTKRQEWERERGRELKRGEKNTTKKSATLVRILSFFDACVLISLSLSLFPASSFPFALPLCSWKYSGTILSRSVQTLRQLDWNVCVQET